MAWVAKGVESTSCRETFGVTNRGSSVAFDARLDVYIEEISGMGYEVLMAPEEAYIAVDSPDVHWLSEHVAEWTGRGGRVATVDREGQEATLNSPGMDNGGQELRARVYGDAVVDRDGTRLLVLRATEAGELDALMPRDIAESDGFASARKDLQAAKRNTTVRSIDCASRRMLGSSQRVEVVGSEEQGKGTDDYTIKSRFVFKRDPRKH